MLPFSPGVNVAGEVLGHIKNLKGSPMGESASVVALRGCLWPTVRGAPEKVSSGGEGEDVGLENGAGAGLEIGESSIQDVINH